MLKRGSISDDQFHDEFQSTEDDQMTKKVLVSKNAAAKVEFWEEIEPPK